MTWSTSPKRLLGGARRGAFERPFALFWIVALCCVALLAGSMPGVEAKCLDDVTVLSDEEITSLCPDFLLPLAHAPDCEDIASPPLEALTRSISAQLERNCDPQCVFDITSPVAKVWTWDSVARCWTSKETRDCLSPKEKSQFVKFFKCAKPTNKESEEKVGEPESDSQSTNEFDGATTAFKKVHHLVRPVDSNAQEPKAPVNRQQIEEPFLSEESPKAEVFEKGLEKAEEKEKEAYDDPQVQQLEEESLVEEEESLLEENKESDLDEEEENKVTEEDVKETHPQNVQEAAEAPELKGGNERTAQKPLLEAKETLKDKREAGEEDQEEESESYFQEDDNEQEMPLNVASSQKEALVHSDTKTPSSKENPAESVQKENLGGSKAHFSEVEPKSVVERNRENAMEAGEAAPDQEADADSKKKEKEEDEEVKQAQTELSEVNTLNDREAKDFNEEVDKEDQLDGAASEDQKEGEEKEEKKIGDKSSQLLKDGEGLHTGSSAVGGDTKLDSTGLKPDLDHSTSAQVPSTVSSHFIGDIEQLEKEQQLEDGQKKKFNATLPPPKDNNQAPPNRHHDLFGPEDDPELDLPKVDKLGGKSTVGQPKSTHDEKPLEESKVLENVAPEDDDANLETQRDILKAVELKNLVAVGEHEPVPDASRTKSEPASETKHESPKVTSVSNPKPSTFKEDEIAQTNTGSKENSNSANKQEIEADGQEIIYGETEENPESDRDDVPVETAVTVADELRAHLAAGAHEKIHNKAQGEGDSREQKDELREKVETNGNSEENLLSEKEPKIIGENGNKEILESRASETSLEASTPEAMATQGLVDSPKIAQTTKRASKLEDYEDPDEKPKVSENKNLSSKPHIPDEVPVNAHDTKVKEEEVEKEKEKEEEAPDANQFTTQSHRPHHHHNHIETDRVPVRLRPLYPEEAEQEVEEYEPNEKEDEQPEILPQGALGQFGEERQETFNSNLSNDERKNDPYHDRFQETQQKSNDALSNLERIEKAYEDRQDELQEELKEAEKLEKKVEEEEEVLMKNNDVYSAVNKNPEESIQHESAADSKEDAEDDQTVESQNSLEGEEKKPDWQGNTDRLKEAQEYLKQFTQRKQEILSRDSTSNSALGGKPFYTDQAHATEIPLFIDDEEEGGNVAFVLAMFLFLFCCCAAYVFFRRPLARILNGRKKYSRFDR